MVVDVLTLDQKKQALAKGLSPFLQGNVLERVLQYWEQHYGNQPSFALNRFLQEICTTDELRLHRKEMLREVLFEIAAVEKQIRLNTQPRVKVCPVPSVKTEKLVSGALSDAFVQFVQQVLRAVGAADRAEFEHAFKQQLQELRLSINPLQHVDEPEFLEFLPLSNYAKVITALYEIYCDFYGPVKADQIYAQSRLGLKNSFPDVDLHQLL